MNFGLFCNSRLDWWKNLVFVGGLLDESLWKVGSNWNRCSQDKSSPPLPGWMGVSGRQPVKVFQNPSQTLGLESSCLGIETPGILDGQEGKKNWFVNPGIAKTLILFDVYTKTIPFFVTFHQVIWGMDFESRGQPQLLSFPKDKRQRTWLQEMDQRLVLVPRSLKSRLMNQ